MNKLSKNVEKRFEEEFGDIKAWQREGEAFYYPKAELKQHLADELQKQREEIGVKKTLVAVPEGYKFVEVLHIGKIKTKAIKNIPNGAEYYTMYIDELNSLKKGK